MSSAHIAHSGLLNAMHDLHPPSFFNSLKKIKKFNEFSDFIRNFNFMDFVSRPFFAYCWELYMQLLLISKVYLTNAEADSPTTCSAPLINSGAF
ncbi:hypothetical protein BpHYR1_014127 [Brachionus plicatilis]|uniref:Uncharacterized protein n=1 Tax=Brachionus plicatilis TaxID=10195 RepID=A0A3M7RZZ6_BRAPC|nr:hypothetical protein BpHYR1_014127 [Brachionus plicatilis]